MNNFRVVAIRNLLLHQGNNLRARRERRGEKEREKRQDYYISVLSGIYSNIHALPAA